MMTAEEKIAKVLKLRDALRDADEPLRIVAGWLTMILEPEIGCKIEGSSRPKARAQ